MKKSDYIRVFLCWLFAIIGIALITYPLVSTYYNEYNQGKINDLYSQTQNSLDDNTKIEKVEEARKWNKENESRLILDPWIDDATQQPEYHKYFSILNDTKVTYDGEENSVMSIVTIPKIGVDQPLYHGTSDKTLSRALGHLYGTSLPVGGENTHTVITGHTGLRTKVIFDRLRELEKGDPIYIDTYGIKMKYVVYDTDVVLPNEIDSLKMETGKDLLTLITCTPYGINSHRLLVHAERVPMDDDEYVEEKVESPAPDWMWFLLAIALIILILIIWWTINYIINTRKYYKELEEKSIKISEDKEED